MNSYLYIHMKRMTETQLYDALYRDHLTKALNRQAFEYAREHARESVPKKFVAVIDLDSLKYINDNLGHRYGDIQLVNLALRLSEEFGDDNVYRLSGDEFAIRGATPLELRNKLLMIRRKFPGFSFGFGSTLSTADWRLRIDKRQRERNGMRSPRGETPPWLPTIKEIPA